MNKGFVRKTFVLAFICTVKNDCQALDCGLTPNCEAVPRSAIPRRRFFCVCHEAYLWYFLKDSFTLLREFILMHLIKVIVLKIATVTEVLPEAEEAVPVRLP